ncbi:MAG: DNA polymerase I [Aquincola sp.]|nr:DNA polymerase I [Aquincola sp.]
MNPSASVLLLVDGSSYLYRAYHALPNLTGPGGVPTGAIHGFIAMLGKLRSDHPAAHAACVFDAKGKTFRDDWYPEYKANRSPMPEDLAQQIAPIHEAVRLLGWPVLEVPGIEADDAIGTLAKRAAAAGQRVIVSTGDKDLAQLVDEHVTLINTMSGERLDIDGVKAKFGVPPDRIVDYLTLVGDSVDNVPGVDKVGPKTAAKWIAEHGSLDAVIANADAIGGAVGANLKNALDWLPMGRKLVTVATDCDLSAQIEGWPSLDGLALREVDRDALLDFYTRYGFKAFKRELEVEEGTVQAVRPDSSIPQDRVRPAGASKDERRAGPSFDTSGRSEQPPQGERTCETILSQERLDQWLVKVKAAPLAAFDTETTSLDAMAARIVGVSFAVAPGEAAYVPLAHDYPDAPVQLPLDAVLAQLKPWLEDERAAKVGQHVKYDTHVLANHGIAARGFVHDTLLESYVLEAHLNHSLDKLAERHLQRKGITYEEVCGKGAHQIPFSQVDVEKAAEYSGEDSEMTLAVHRVLWPQLEADAKQRFIYEHIEMPVSALLRRIERHGVLIDSALLAQQSRELAERMVALEREAYEIAGQPFNMGSPKQIGDVLFTKLGLPVKKKTASGAPSTDEDVLTELAADYPLPAKILEHRSFSKLKGTYTDKLPQMVNAQTGRVHTSYAQAVAVTGRLSSNDPNLQNIPIRTPEGRRIREAFIAPPGHVIASADYSQIELRIMAHISGDEALTRAFTQGIDVHRATASEVFGVAVDQVSAEQRRYAKTINFGLIYGMGAFGLSQALGIEQKAARDYIDRYFARFAGVKRYMDETKAFVRANGFVTTIFGRVCHYPQATSKNPAERAFVERQAINAPIQGSASDIIRRAMIRMEDALGAARLNVRMLLQVHDELVFEVPDEEVEKTLPVVTKELVRDLVPDLKVLNGYVVDKVEGFAVDAAGTGWVITDNDGVSDNSGETLFWSIGAVN